MSTKLLFSQQAGACEGEPRDHKTSYNATGPTKTEYQEALARDQELKAVQI